MTADRRVALIPGGGRGIGRAVALALATRGWDLSLAYLSQADAARQTSREAEELGSTVSQARCDVSDPDQTHKLVADTLEAHGRVDALICCAGLYKRVPLLEETPGGWQRAFDVNLHSFFYLASAVAPVMRQQKWGRLLAFGVAGASFPRAFSHVTAHHVAKLGLVSLARSLGRVLAPDGITVNVVSPGFVDSGGLSESELARGLRLIPAGQVGEVRDVVETAVYLLSDQASYVTGAEIPVSGGFGI